MQREFWMTAAATANRVSDGKAGTRPRAAPALLRRARRAAGVLALALLASLALLPPAPAQAQSVSVSNLSQASHATDLIVGATAIYANAFTTGGSSTDRYTVNSVVVNFANTGSGEMNVSIHNADGSNPGTQIGSLTGTFPSGGGNATYTASGITLSGGTKYFLQFAVPNGTRSVRITTSDSQTGTGGWSAATIANEARNSANNGATWGALGSGRSLKFTVNATTVTSTPPPPTTRAPVQRPWNFRSILRDGYVSLSWTPVPRATAYQYRHNTTGTFSSSDAWSNLSFAYVRQFAVVRAHAGVHGLTLGTTNYIQVRGVNADGQGPGSVILRIVPLAAPPAPTLTSATAGNRSVTLAWTVGIDPTRMEAAAYRYKRIEAEADGTCSEAAFRRAGLWWAGSQPSETVSNLTAGQKYCFRVVSANQGQGADSTRLVIGPESNTRTATPFGPPPPVENIRITHNGTSLTVRWDASAGATGYDVTYQDNATGRNARAAWDHAGTSVTITCDSRYPGQNRDCVRSGATYSVGVRAKGQHGPSEWRNAGRPRAAPEPAPPPEPPAGDSCETRLAGDGRASGWWNERCDSAARRERYAHYYSFTLAAQSTVDISLESRIDTYLYLRSGGRDGPVVHRNDDWGGGYNSRISETLAAGTYTIEATTYRRWEIGSFTLGVSGLGSTAPPEGTDPPPPVDESTAPDPVTNIRVTHNGTSLSVDWDAPARATAYDVTYYDTGSRRNWRAAWNRAGTSLRITCDVRPEHSNEGCINSHIYTVGIRARNAAGTSAWTNSGRASPGGGAGAAAPAHPALSVADATAAESSGSIAFAVTLSPAASRWVYVDYSTHDGTASAGLDYTAASGTLTFRPGETRKTVTLALLDDVHDEGSETLELMLSNAQGALLEDGLATGTITNADPLQRDWLARFGRAAATDAIAAVTARLETPRDAGSHFTIAGQRLPFGDEGGGTGSPGSRPGGRDLSKSGARGAGLPPIPAGGLGNTFRLPWSGDLNRGPSGDGSRSMSERELLMGTSFRAVLGGGAGAQWTGWGQGASVSAFSSGTPGLSLSGETATGSLGMDYERGRLLTGFAMTHSLGEGTAHGAGRSYVMGSTVTTVLPYARYALSERLSVWGLAGTGSGRLTLDLDGAAAERYRADLAMTLAAMGVRGELVTPEEAGGFALALKADGFWVRTESESVSAPGAGNLAGARADASRLRAVLDGSRAFALASGGTLTPSLSLGVRHDGGDAETGTGLELGAGVGYADPSRGLDMVLKVHGLAAHAEGGYNEWGVSGQLRLAPGGAGRGLSMSLTPSYGADPGGSERLWTLPDAGALAMNGDAPLARRLDAEVGYGLPLFSSGFTGTPNVGFGLSDTARELRMGWRLAPADGGGFAFSVDAAQRDSAGAEPEHRVGFGLTARW